MKNKKNIATEGPEDTKNRRICIRLSPLQDAKLQDINQQTGQGDTETISGLIDFYIEMQSFYQRWKRSDELKGQLRAKEIDHEK